MATKDCRAWVSKTVRTSVCVLLHHIVNHLLGTALLTPGNFGHMLLIILLSFPLFAICYALFLVINQKSTSRIFTYSRTQRGLHDLKTRESTSIHSLSFPPSCRHALPGSSSDVDRTLPEINRQQTEMLPDKRPADSIIHQDHFTATGVSLREIQQLGDFPDYATLSGVPLPNAYREFDITKAMARPYRPFRWAYHQTMSLQKLDSNWWLELDRNYVETVRLRQELYKEHGSDVLQALPGSELAAKELVEMCLQFLCARYPQYFHLSESNTIFHNTILGTQTFLRSTSPFEILLQNIPEDFAIMLRDPETGIYTFRAGIIMSSLGWTLGSKIGKKLDEIHGPVPEYKEKMRGSMDRFFSKMPAGKPIQRGSWGIEIGKPLYMPPGPQRDALKGFRELENGIKDLHLRVDWQTLRRLPLSGAVVFNFKGLFTPVEEFRDEAYIPTLLLKVLKEGKESLMDHKKSWCTENIVIPTLEEYEREQIEKGLVEKNWEPCTLEESPFFPGWQEKWHCQQGF